MEGSPRPFVAPRPKNRLFYRSGPTWDTELSDWCRERIGARFRGVICSDETPTRIGAYLYNTDVRDGPGVHWCALLVRRRGALSLYYDSFGDPPNRVFASRMEKQGRPLLYADSGNQQLDEENCGQRACLALQMLCASRDPERLLRDVIGAD